MSRMLAALAVSSRRFFSTASGAAAQTKPPSNIILFVPDGMRAALAAAGITPMPPARGENGKIGDFKTPGTTPANVEH